jgi:hypothetical protein
MKNFSVYCVACGCRWAVVGNLSKLAADDRKAYYESVYPACKFEIQ